jgi:hypothetical protein
MGISFFGALFQQFVALLSVFCIAPTPTYSVYSVAPPGIEVAAARDVGAPADLRQQPLIIRAFQTQVDGLLGDGGIGDELSRGADRVLNDFLRVPNALGNALDNGGVSALPGGIARAGIATVGDLGDGTNNVIDAVAELLIKNLQLLPGTRAAAYDATTYAKAPSQDFGAVGRALLAAPTYILGQLQRGGPGALPGALNELSQQLVVATATDAKALVTALSSATQAVLALVPGAQLNRAQFTVAARDDSSSSGGPLQVVVRIPIAAGVAASDLATAGARATVIVVTAVVTAVTDIANAARPRQRNDEVMAAFVAEPRQLTVPEAIAQAPRTIGQGVVRAGGVLQQGAVDARTDFVKTVRGRQTEVEQRQVAGDNLLVAGDNSTITNSKDGNSAGVEKLATKPNKPRPVLGAIKTVTGTLKAVRDGLRTALGLPTKKPKPAAEATPAQ